MIRLCIYAFSLVVIAGCQRVSAAKDAFQMGKSPVAARQVRSEEDFGWSYDKEGYMSAPALDALDRGEKITPSYGQFVAPGSQIAAFFRPIYFEKSKHGVQTQENFEKIKATARYLKSHPRLLIFIEGHCDKRGSPTYNLALGSRRANSVRQALIDENVEEGRIQVITFGSDRPARSGNTEEEAWRWNRRAEYKIFQK